MNRTDRHLALILFLQAKRTTTAEELAAHFGVSVRTIYRDMAALGEAGVPIAAEAGAGYALMPGYHLPPVNFTESEAYALATASMILDRLADPALRAETGSAMLKIRSVLPRRRQELLARLEKSLASAANTAQPAQADLSLLQQAIANRLVLRLEYHGAARGTPTFRDVEPMSLLHYLDRWHLIAWCRLRNDFRDFRTDRMANIRVLAESFEPRPDFSAEDYLDAYMPSPGLNARVHFSRDVADRARREWWMGIEHEEDTDDGCILTLATVDWEYLARWLLTFGADVTILEPEPLRQVLLDICRQALEQHSR